jgi:hypothetical protein
VASSQLAGDSSLDVVLEDSAWPLCLLQPLPPCCVLNALALCAGLRASTGPASYLSAESWPRQTLGALAPVLACNLDSGLNL